VLTGGTRRRRPLIRVSLPARAARRGKAALGLFGTIRALRVGPSVLHGLHGPLLGFQGCVVLAIGLLSTVLKPSLNLGASQQYACNVYCV
jgi:hypothetical protein